MNEYAWQPVDAAQSRRRIDRFISDRRFSYIDFFYLRSFTSRYLYLEFCDSSNTVRYDTFISNFLKMDFFVMTPDPGLPFFWLVGVNSFSQFPFLVDLSRIL